MTDIIKEIVRVGGVSIIPCIVLGIALYYLWQRNVELTDTMIDTLEKNQKVMSRNADALEDLREEVRK